MLFSMTGYGKVSEEISGKNIQLEIRTLNSKNFDFYSKVPNQYKALENEIRKIISDTLTRGKIDFFLSVNHLEGSSSVKINHQLAKAYYEELKTLNETIGQKEVDYLSMLLRMPEIFITSSDELGEEEKETVLEFVKNACQAVNEFRRQEGIALEKEFTKQIEEIRTLLGQIEPYEEERISTIRERLLSSLSEIGEYDENRFQQELIYYLEKLDVSEEKMRLTNHLDYFLKTMNDTNENVGKKLGFISQEIGREINTLGSKCSHAAIQKIVVNMKDALEKIKEQVLNTL